MLLASGNKEGKKRMAYINGNKVLLEVGKDIDIDNGVGENAVQQTLRAENFTTVNENINNNSDIEKDESGNIKSGALGDYSASFGGKSQAKGKGAFSVGVETVALGKYSSAEGNATFAMGNNAHSEGLLTSALGESSHSEGNSTVAEGETSHAEGYYTKASGARSHSEGESSIASGHASHAEGYYTKASGQGSHSEGNETNAIGDNSHAEGNGCTAGNTCHAEGCQTTAGGFGSHAEGGHTTTGGNFSHAGGHNTKAMYDAQTAIGEFNNNKSDTLFEVGNGTSDTARSNAFEVKKNGSIVVGGVTLTPEQLTALLALLG